MAVWAVLAEAGSRFAAVAACVMTPAPLNVEGTAPVAFCSSSAPSSSTISSLLLARRTRPPLLAAAATVAAVCEGADPMIGAGSGDRGGMSLSAYGGGGLAGGGEACTMDLSWLCRLARMWLSLCAFSSSSSGAGRLRDRAAAGVTVRGSVMAESTGSSMESGSNGAAGAAAADDWSSEEEEAGGAAMYSASSTSRSRSR